ncbi:hypothetical protein GH714_032608 [Hevea brasiliensis]|uniref:Uncharacterized protein n=1 Tax=Hevea brasiliensis TaxID=3981 RepID=A0A6A6M2D6_HEVBR|nr:hypothetical protein GH714_032608 [Hevea brasiliensis]
MQVTERADSVLAFFKARGFSKTHIATLICKRPSVLVADPKNRFAQTPIFCTPTGFQALTLSMFYAVSPNIKILQESGLPKSSIAWLLRYHPSTFITSTNQFSEIVEEVKGMELNPLSVNFVAAIQAVREMGKPAWKGKLDTYKKWGWSIGHSGWA